MDDFMTNVDIDIIAHKVHQYRSYQNSIYGLIEQMEEKLKYNLSVITAGSEFIWNSVLY